MLIMGFVPLLLISLPLSLVNSCLVIQYPVTSTPKPFCGCPFKVLNDTNLKETVGNNSYYPTVNSQRLLDPSTSGDNCSRSLTCPSDFDLVVFNMDQHKLFNDVELSAMCDPFSQQWLVDDGIHEIETFSQLYVTCARLEDVTEQPQYCKCPLLFPIIEGMLPPSIPGLMTDYTALNVRGVPNTCVAVNITCATGDVVYLSNGSDFFSTGVSSCLVECRIPYPNPGDYYYENQILVPLEGVVEFACVQYPVPTTVAPIPTTSPPPCWCPSPTALTNELRARYDPNNVITGTFSNYSMETVDDIDPICNHLSITCSGVIYIIFNGKDPIEIEPSVLEFTCRRPTIYEGPLWEFDYGIISERNALLFACVKK